MVMTCKSCGLSQFVPISGSCRRCKVPLGLVVIEIPILILETGADSFRFRRTVE